MKKNNRLYGIDIIKIFAAFLVISVHHFNTIGFYDQPTALNKLMIGTTALYLITLSCVPLFLTVSGYLLSNAKPTKIYYRKILYFLIEVFIIYMIIMAISLLSKDAFNFSHFIKNSIKGFLSPQYYVGLYFSLYLFAPFLNQMFFSLDDKDKRLLMFIIIIVISLPTLFNLIPHVNFFDTRPTSIWAVQYYVLGLYIKHFKPKLSTIKTLFGIVLVTFFYGLSINLLLKGKPYQNLFGYYQNIFTMITTFFIFILLYQIQIQNKILRKILGFLSSSTLTFYLLSGIWGDPKARSIIKLKNIYAKDWVSIFYFGFISMIYMVPFALIVFLIISFIKKNIRKYI